MKIAIFIALTGLALLLAYNGLDHSGQGFLFDQRAKYAVIGAGNITDNFTEEELELLLSKYVSYKAQNIPEDKISVKNEKIKLIDWNDFAEEQDSRHIIETSV